MAAGAVTDGIECLKSCFNVLRTKPLYEQFGFFVGILGPGCNACNSKSFTDAKCDCRPYKLVDECGTVSRPSFKLSEIFKPAYDLLERVTKDNGNTHNLTEKERTAIHVLCKFLEKKDDHEKVLRKILQDRKRTETDITIALAEHLLGRLSPGKYVIDARTENKVQECPCGCQTKITYGSTGIGHEKVWHGFVDILLLSEENTMNTAATVATRSEQSDIGAENQSTNGALDKLSSPPAKKRKPTDGDSPEAKAKTEVKLPIDGCENQAVSQTIVFAMLQRKHPELENHLIPNIVISPEEFYFVMYDVSKDILICTPRYPIFDTNSHLSLPVVLIIWIVLHHKLFCSGVPRRGPLNVVQSKFKLRASEAWDIYSDRLRESVSCFPQVVIDHLECSLSTYYQEVSFI